jgi:hypothetical protein
MIFLILACFFVVMKIMAHHDCHPILSNERKIMTHHDFPHPGLLGVMKIMAHHDYHPILSN